MPAPRHAQWSGSLSQPCLSGLLGYRCSVAATFLIAWYPPFIHTGGDRGKAECGASAEGWRKRPALALFLYFRYERDRRAEVALATGGPPSSPSLSAPVKAPRKRGFCFLAVVTPAYLCWPGDPNNPARFKKDATAVCIYFEMSEAGVRL